eukprot:1794630-Pyramimonas_sp.AAC.1
MALALRRCISNVAASKIGWALEVDVARSTVTAWEVKVNASLQARSQATLAECQALMWDPMEADKANKFCFAVHTIRSDATNAAAWQKIKLHALHA